MSNRVLEFCKSDGGDKAMREFTMDLAKTLVHVLPGAAEKYQLQKWQMACVVAGACIANATTSLSTALGRPEDGEQLRNALFDIVRQYIKDQGLVP